MDQLTKTTLDSLDSPKKRQVLILGGGFGGVKAALELAGTFKFEVTLICDQTNFRYYPMLYRTATGGSHKSSSIPLSEIFAAKDLALVNDSAISLDRSKKLIKCESGKTYPYDLLIVALGSVTNFFGVKGLREHAFGIKTIEQAQHFRNHLHQQLLDDQRPDLNYVIIGGGATGVELAGVLPAYIKHIMKRHGLQKRPFRVDIVEAEDRLMPRMSTKHSAAISKRLRKLGVKLYLGQKVLAETAEALKISDRSLTSETVVWTAGVTTHPFLANNGFELSERGKAVVDDLLQSEEDIYVIGDNAETKFSGMAQTALYDGMFVANNLKYQASGKALKNYQAKRPIYVTPVGPFWAAVSWGKREFFGRLGWLLRKMADLAAYHDLEPWWKASGRWMAENDTEESCPVCFKSN